MQEKATMCVHPDGTVTLIYADATRDVALSIGVCETRRASHVEPDDAGRWLADLTPVGGPVLGPYDLRADALLAEAAWLEAHGIPFPPTTEQP